MTQVYNTGKEGLLFNMSGLYLNKDGTYKDKNYNIVGRSGQGMNEKAYAYLKKKYGKQYADRANENVIAGNVYQDNKWRANDTSSKETVSYDLAVKNVIAQAPNNIRKDRYGYAFKDSKGGWTYFNQTSKDKQLASRSNTNTLFNGPLTIDQIPTKNKIHIIDDYSPNFNYIVEDNKIYYGKKGLPYWRDISDNNTARQNLFNHLSDKYNFRGYDDRERDIYSKMQKNAFDYKSYGNDVNSSRLQPLRKVQQQPDKQEKKWYEVENPGDAGIIWNNLVNGNISNALNLIYNGAIRKLQKSFGIGEEKSVSRLLNPARVTPGEYGIRPGSFTGDTIRISKNNRLYIVPESIDANEYTYGIRNRGDYSPINTEGAVITAFHDFVPYGKQRKANTYIGVDRTGKLKAGDISQFSNGDYLTDTYSNDVVSFKKANGKIQYKEDPGNPGRKVPITTTTLNKNGSLNVLTEKGADVGNTYGNVNGGRVLVRVGDELRILSGSVEDIDRQFEQMKARNHANYGTFYTLDNGSYNRGLRTYDKKLTMPDLKKYDAQNTTGGNFLYLKSKSQQFPSDTIWTPNVRTTADESYKKGHSLINKQRGIVLHHTADMNSDTSGTVARLTNKKSQVSSHVVIGYNGERKVLAKPNLVTFHAGASRWNGKNNVNDFMVGIEFQGDTNKKNLTQKLIDSAVEYMAPIIRKNNISLNDIVTHEQVRSLYNEYIKKNGGKQAAGKPDINYSNYVRVINALKKKVYYKK